MKVQGVPKLMAPWRDSRIAHFHIVLCGKTVTSDFYVEEVLNGGDKASNGEHGSNSTAVKLRPDMSQSIFKQDKVLAHTAARTKR